MLMTWWRNDYRAAIVAALLRIYLGWLWLEAGWHKIAGSEPFDATGFIKRAIDNPVTDRATGEIIYPTYTAFLKHIALPNVDLINILVPYGEVLVGIGLIVGGLTTAAAFFGLLMNFMFLFAGTVSTNPWFVLIGALVLVAGANAGRYGLDRYLRKLYAKWRAGAGRPGGVANGDGVRERTVG
ncbi:MAG: Crp/Fnr family transcriptional regulator [Candidatus Reconcilbacillus cellulovorans]|uniref:Crp/Fnr family transcriptional regulator n=1 Tax=Candidatus Reconcilbacillus cellulovorans TaxID=1906605 RepID=A0A2A6E0F0_9BACL|nr:MAG: Crp/Fnr family transcriptional regulator [Candidatus Reconcilbacillus cellulovorans]